MGVWPSACCARALGFTGAAAGAQTMIADRMPLESTHIFRYQTPAPDPFAGPRPSPAISSATFESSAVSASYEQTGRPWPRPVETSAVAGLPGLLALAPTPFPSVQPSP